MHLDRAKLIRRTVPPNIGTETMASQSDVDRKGCGLYSCLSESNTLRKLFIKVLDPHRGRAHFAKFKFACGKPGVGINVEVGRREGLQILRYWK